MAAEADGANRALTPSAVISARAPARNRVQPLGRDGRSDVPVRRRAGTATLRAERVGVYTMLPWGTGAEAPTGGSTGCDVARDATASTVRAGGEVLDPQTK